MSGMQTQPRHTLHSYQRNKMHFSKEIMNKAPKYLKTEQTCLGRRNSENKVCCLLVFHYKVSVYNIMVILFIIWLP